MSYKKVYDYDPEHDETIIINGVQGCEITWVGISLDTGQERIDIVMKEGVLAEDGKSIDTVTRKGQQETIAGSEVLDLYAAHADAFDEITNACYALWASKRGKTGVVIE